MKSWKLVVSLSLGILLLALFLRIYHLTMIPVFADEAIYIRWAQVMRNVPELRFLPLSDGKQPLFMWSVIPFFKIFSDPLIAGRMVSVLCGMGTMAGVFVLSLLLFNRDPRKPSLLKVPLLSAFIYAISPFALFFDRMALADAMLSMFGIWTFIFAFLTVRFLRLDFAMIAGFALGGALLTKSPALYFVILLPISLLFFNFERKERFARALKTILLWLVTWGIGYGFYNILRLGPNFQMLSSRNLDYVYPFIHILENPLDPFRPFMLQVLDWLMIMGPWVFILLIIGGILINFSRFSRQIVFLILLAFAPIVASAEYAKVFTARYIFFSIPFLCILGASVVLNMARYRLLVMCALVIFTLHSFFIDFLYLTAPAKAPIPRSERSGYLEEWTAGYGIKEVSELMREEYSKDPNTKIVVGTEGYFGTLPDGLQIYLNDIPQITIIGVGQPIRNVHESLLASREAGNKTYLVVNDSRFLGDAEKLGLKLVQKYPKAEKPDGTSENLLLFEIE